MKIRQVAIACALVAAFGPSSTASASDGGMQKLFDDMGAYGNATGPGAYKAQGMNIVSGGSLFMRVPQRNYKLAQVELPSLKYGCGGIDLHAGSFSFVGKAQLVAMMKNIGSAAVTYAFQLALDSISPQINKILTGLQSTAQAINSTNINSCEAGQAITKGLTGDWQETQKWWAKTSGPITGLFADHSDAREQTEGDDGKTNSALAAISDPKAKAQALPGNVAWRALASMGGLDDTDRKLLMSLSGTVILSPDVEKAPDYRSPKNITVEQFVRGDDSGKFEVYDCTDGTLPDQCMTLADVPVTIKPFSHHVEAKLVAIADKFKTNTALTSDEIKFINVTPVPVYKALAVHTAKKNADDDLRWIARYSDLIAAEYAYAFIVQVTKQLQTAYTQQGLGSGSTARAELDKMTDNMAKLKEQALATVTSAYTKVQSMERIAAEIAQAERALMMGLPSNLAGNVRFAASMK